jgi:hypothetical protein
MVIITRVMDDLKFFFPEQKSGFQLIFEFAGDSARFGGDRF